MCLVCLQFFKGIRLFSSVSTITEKRDTGLYVPLSMCLLGFGMGTRLANFHMCGIMLVLRAVSRCSLGMRVQEGLSVIGT